MNINSVLYNDAVQKEIYAREHSEHQNDYFIMDSLIKELNDLGYNFSYATDLIFYTIDNKSAIPIIQRYIPQFNDIGFSMSLVPHITIKNNDECAAFLIDFYHQCNEQHKLSDVAYNCFDNAFYKIGSKKHIKTYLSLINIPDKFYFTMEMLSKWKINDALPIIIKRLHSDDLKLPAIRSLGNYKNSQLELILKPFLVSSNAAIRKATEKSLIKIKK